MNTNVALSEFTSKRKTTWQSVMKAWEKREKGIWDEYIQKKGFRDWMHFRFGTQSLKIASLNWYALKVKDLMITAPKILCGPYQGWAQYNPNRLPDGSGRRESYAFGIIAESSTIVKNSHVNTIQNKLASKGVSRGVGFYCNGNLVLIDGHHSLSAICLNLKQKKPINSELVLHVAMIPEDLEDYFEKYKMGEVPSKLF